MCISAAVLLEIIRSTAAFYYMITEVTLMKNQYVGDIGDYGKYGLLRFLANKGKRIGVNWYLTDDDHGNDGNMREYLKHDEESNYDSAVYSLLKSMPDKDKSVSYIEKSGIIPNAVFYSTPLSTANKERSQRAANRLKWHQDALYHLCHADLIFCDPDNGSANDIKAISKTGEKYALIGELHDYYRHGRDVVYYCHRARRNSEKWKEKVLELAAPYTDAKIIVLTFRRGMQRSYIFCIHPTRYEEYSRIIDEFLQTDWGTKAIGKKNIPFFREL